MTISTELRKAGPFTGNGVTTAFPFSFKVFAATDVAVTVANTQGNESALALGADYAVALNADQDAAPGGTVTLAAPLASGHRLVVSSAVPNLQPTDITNNGGFYPRVIEDALDRHVAQIQQIDEKVDRALKVAVTSPLGGQALPSPVAGMLIGWNESNDGLKNYAPIGGTLLGQQLAAANGSSLVGFQQAGAGAVVRTAQDKLREWVSVKDFGAVGDGVTDDTAAIQAAIDYCATFAKWPSLRIIGLCLVTAPLIINRMVDTTTSEFLIVGEGTDSGLYTTTAITLFDSSLPFTIDPQSEFVTFSNLRFACNNAATTAYTISNKFLRVRFSGCYFHKIKCAVSSIYIQSWYFSNCNARFWSGIFLDVLTAFDVDFQSNIFEFGGPLFRTETLCGVRFIGNLYEGSSSPMIDLAGANGLMVVGNYTEGNAALDYRFGRTLGDVSRGIFFSGNVMLPTTLNVSNTSFYNVQWGLAYGVSQGNFCSSRLHDTTFNTNDALSFIGDVSDIELYKGHKTGLTDPARVAVGRAVGIDTSKLFAASGNSYVALHPGLGGLELNISEIAGESLHMLLAPASPASGYFGSQPFVRGSIVFNSAAAVGAPKGWQCTVSGTPGTWISMGNL